MLRYTTAGESHGPGLTAILEGIPAGLVLSRARIDADLARRQAGYGRGGRMRIEKDRAEIRGGVRFGRTLGSPIAIWIPNLDFENWGEAMAVWGPAPADEGRARRVRRPRPGHGDLAGALKYGTHDARDVLERASARETAARVAAGAVAKALLARLGISIVSHTVRVGSAALADPLAVPFERIAAIPPLSPLRCASSAVEHRMLAQIDAAMRAGDSVGGAFQVVARGAPPGLGSVASAGLRLDARLAAAFMAIPAVKAVSIGAGVEGASARGSRFHDGIHHARGRGFYRETNRAGGIEGGMSNGEEIRVTGYLKPLSTLSRPLASVDLLSKRPSPALVERTDTIPILAAGVVGEASAALVLARAALEKFGGDSVRETSRNHRAFLRALLRY
jgi:chorismate synthase